MCPKGTHENTAARKRIVFTLRNFMCPEGVRNFWTEKYVMVIEKGWRVRKGGVELGKESWILKYYKGVEEKKKVSERHQKNYIMPLEYVEESIKRKYSEYYEWNGEVNMGYRKYLWEGKPKMKKMPYEVFMEMGEFLKTLPEPEIDY